MAQILPYRQQQPIGVAKTYTTLGDCAFQVTMATKVIITWTADIWLRNVFLTAERNRNATEQKNSFPLN